MAFVSLPVLVRTTVADPAEGVRQLLALNIPREARWMAFALVSILTVLPTEALLAAVPAGDLSPWELAMRRPVFAVVAQGATMILAAGAIRVVGSWFGGTARFADALLSVTWVQFIMFLFQVAQFVLLAVLPPLGILFSMVSLAVFLWLIVGITAALNGFTNRLLVLVGVVLTTLAAAFCLGILAVALGVVPEFAPNV
jgi:hypothetical protein